MQPEKQHQSIRLFENDLLERLSHVHPITPLLMWGPIVAWLLWRSLSLYQLPGLPVLAIALAGAFIWTLTEYCLHRYLFHYQARSETGKWLVFMFHGCLIFGLAIPQPWIQPFCAGFIVGYLIYDYIHYSTHHFPMRNPLAKFIKHYHLKHHYTKDGGRFGVSSPVWDWVFGTDPGRG